MAEPHSFSTALTWDAARRGTATPPGLPPLEVATPPPFPGGIEGVWSPEHLFISAAEVCLMTTFLAIAENSKLEFVSYRSEAEGLVEKTESGFKVTRIVIRPEVVVSDPQTVDKTLRLLEKAEKHCLISNSMTTTVELDATVRAQ